MVKGRTSKKTIASNALTPTINSTTTTSTFTHAPVSTIVGAIIPTNAAATIPTNTAAANEATFFVGNEDLGSIPPFPTHETAMAAAVAAATSAVTTIIAESQVDVEQKVINNLMGSEAMALFLFRNLIKKKFSSERLILERGFIIKMVEAFSCFDTVPEAAILGMIDTHPVFTLNIIKSKLKQVKQKIRLAIQRFLIITRISVCLILFL
jgi:hypothetical protein